MHPHNYYLLRSERSEKTYICHASDIFAKVWEDEKPKIFMKTDAIKPLKKEEGGAAFHEKSAKNSKVNFIVRHKDRMMKKYGKPIKRGAKKKK